METKRISVENAELLVKNMELGIDLIDSEMSKIDQSLSCLDGIRKDEPDGTVRSKTRIEKLDRLSELKRLKNEQIDVLERAKKQFEALRSL
jgi:hypothetical protein